MSFVEGRGVSPRNLTAVAGAGNLLGNLLCAVVHLLDENPLSAAVQNLLNQINAILAAL